MVDLDALVKEAVTEITAFGGDPSEVVARISRENLLTREWTKRLIERTNVELFKMNFQRGETVFPLADPKKVFELLGDKEEAKDPSIVVPDPEMSAGSLDKAAEDTAVETPAAVQIDPAEFEIEPFFGEDFAPNVSAAASGEVPLCICEQKLPRWMKEEKPAEVEKRAESVEEKLLRLNDLLSGRDWKIPELAKVASALDRSTLERLRFLRDGGAVEDPKRTEEVLSLMREVGLLA